MRFLLTRRWIGFALAVVALACGCYWLGVWQFHRLHSREALNVQIVQNLRATPVPVAHLAGVHRPPADRDQWRRVTATGQYLAGQSVTLRYQTRNSQSGVDVVTPLRTADGAAVLVDRGWMASPNTNERPRLPAAPPGRVTVTGWLRVDATGDATAVGDRSTRAISSATIAPTVSVPVYRGFMDALSENPAAAHRLVPVERPDLSNGPHLFYGIQWWFFGVLAVFGFWYLAWDELKKRRGGQSARSMPPSTGTMAPDTNDDAGESRKAATAPNSPGRP